MINKIGLLIFILGRHHYTFFNIYNFEPDWKETVYMLLTIAGGIMYAYEGNKE